MSDVMLINPSSKEILKNAGDRPPLGILYLASVLRKRNHNVKIVDMDHYNSVALMDDIEERPPDWVGISVYTSPLYKQAIELSQYLNGRCKTVAGGYHATALPESLTPYFDAVIVGEGEIALPNIIEKNLEGVILGRKMDIEKIPKPARHLINMKDYNFTQDNRPATTLISSRGCPNKCVYCGNMNRVMRNHTIKHVINEVRELKGYGYKDLYFYDDTFTVNKKRTLELIKKLAKEKISYRITTRAKQLDEELIDKLADSGCSWVSLGIESGSDRRLKDIGKNMTTRDNLNAIRLLHKYGIKSKGFFMFGLPNECKKDAKHTIGFSKILKDEGLTTADFYIMIPFPATPIWEHAERYGIEILDRDYTKYLEAGKTKPKAFHRTKFMSQFDIENMRNKAEEEWLKN